MSNPQRRLPQTGQLGRKDPPHEIVPSLPKNLTNRATRAPSHLLIQITQANGVITTLGLATKPRLVLGRSDPTSDFTPDLDLTPYAAQDEGVSRQHAFIFREGDLLFVQDNHSKNRTTLNHLKLEPAQLHALHDGDVLILGRMVLTIYFVYTTSH